MLFQIEKLLLFQSEKNTNSIFDREHRSRGPRNYFDDGDDEWTFRKKRVKNSQKWSKIELLLKDKVSFFARGGIPIFTMTKN